MTQVQSIEGLFSHAFGCVGLHNGKEVRDEGYMEGVWRKGVSKNRLYEVSAAKIPSTKLCEVFWDFVAVSSPLWLTIARTVHE